MMKYVRVPKELSSSELRSGDVVLSPGRYVRFIPPTRQKGTYYVPLDKLVTVRGDTLKAQKSISYRYAEIGDINVSTGNVVFRSMRGFQLPTARPSVAKKGDILISTVRTYRKGIGLVTDEGENLVTTNAILNLCGTTDFSQSVTLPYIYAFLRTDFFVEQVWSLLNRGVYPRMDSGALDKILIPIANEESTCKYVSALILAIADKGEAIRQMHEKGISMFETELKRGSTNGFRYEYPTVQELKDTTRMDAGFWSRKLRETLHTLRSYRRGTFESIYDAGFTTRRGPNLAVSVSGPAYYSDKPFGAALPMATPGDISDYMTIPKFRFYGNRRRVDTVRHGEILFAGKGVREVSIGHTWVNLGEKPFVTNFDSFLVHSSDRTRSICLAFFFSYLKHVGVFAKLSDTSNGGSFVQSHFNALPIPKFDDGFHEKVAKVYHSDAPPPARAIGIDNFVEWHREWNKKLGIWELDREMKILQSTLSSVQEMIIEGQTPRPFFSKSNRSN